MIGRVKTIHKNIIEENDKETMVEYVEGKMKKLIQPMANLEMIFKDSVESLIGLHQNILGIISWRACDTTDKTQQLMGRCLRLNAWSNPLYFYISTNTLDFQ